MKDEKLKQLKRACAELYEGSWVRFLDGKCEYIPEAEIVHQLASGESPMSDVLRTRAEKARTTIWEACPDKENRQLFFDRLVIDSALCMYLQS